MSCSGGGGSCGCGGDKSKPSSADTPVDQYIKSGGASGKPAEPKPVQKAGSWFKKQIIADMRITRVRVLSQAFFFLLFLFFVVVTDLRYLQGYPVSLFLEIDPLVGFALFSEFFGCRCTLSHRSSVTPLCCHVWNIAAALSLVTLFGC